MTTATPKGLVACPRCGLPVEFMVTTHLDRCGEAGNGFSAGRWRARDYLSRSASEQAEMRRVEVADVLCSPVAPPSANSRGSGTAHA